MEIMKAGKEMQKQKTIFPFDLKQLSAAFLIPIY